MISKYSRKNDLISHILHQKDDILNQTISVSGWVRTCRTSEKGFGFCLLNDGSCGKGIQLILSSEYLDDDKLEYFFKNVKTGVSLNATGTVVTSPAKGQDIEIRVTDYKIYGLIQAGYPISKTKIKLDTLRNHCHLRTRTGIFGCIFRIRNTLTKAIHEFYQSHDFLHLDPNVITINECEGGAGVFQVSEFCPKTTRDIPNKSGKILWQKDHFKRPAYLTVSSQLQLEALACSLGNVYTTNKSFRSEHSSTSKHVSEFTHLEIEMVFNEFEDLMNISEDFIRYVINYVLDNNQEDIESLNKFISKGLKEKLIHIMNSEYKRIKYSELVEEINHDILEENLELNKLEYGDDLGSEHENYITKKYNTCVFVTHWPQKIKSFYMKQCDDGTCESFDLLLPYGIGELIGASQREENYEKLLSAMEKKGIEESSLKFYTDLRKYGTCPHGGFGLGFDRLLMFLTGMTNIKDVIPFPVFYTNCSY